MAQAVTTTIDEGVALILIDNPPVNALSEPVIDGLGRELAAANATASVRAIVVMGAGRTFIAGADINGLQQLAWGGDSGAPEMHDLLQAIEDSPRPVVMALHGTALGGGLEVAMAGHYRVAVTDGQMGQPEVNLGIIPGAEGTQRLPRLVGVAKAIDMCVTGRPIGAADALAAGLIDRIVDGDLAAGAVAFARDMATRTAHPKTRERNDRLPALADVPALVAAGRDLASKVRKRQEAPLAAVAAIEAAATLPFDDGCARERALFFDCLRSEQCKALIHVFFAERGAAKVPDVSKETPIVAVGSVGIIGAGTMGGGIAMACANAGIAVRLSDVDRGALDRGMAAIRRNYEISVSRGRFTPESAAERIAAIVPQLSYDGFGEVDLIIEAAFENLALKKEIFGAIDEVARPQCLLATNTSTLDIDKIAGTTRRPEFAVGLHFFSPANVMRLVEIVRGRATAPQTVASAQAFAKRLGKVGVVVGNCPGFVGNRMMFPYMYEAQFLVEDGATPEQVDRALTDFGMAMGIFAVDDMAGLDVAWRVRQELGQFTALDSRRPLVADRLCEMGRFGQKTRAGWYRYGEDRRPIPDDAVLELIDRTAAEAGIVRRPFTAEEIVERTIYALVNEGARVLDEGFALRAADIDVIYVNGYGFPGYRGGPMFYADRVGLGHVLERVEALHLAHGSRWAPAPLLQRLVHDGSSFREHDLARVGARI